MARYALEPIPDPSVDDALRDALGKLKGRLLVGVIGSLGVRRDAKAVDGSGQAARATPTPRSPGRGPRPGQDRHARGRHGPGKSPRQPPPRPIGLPSARDCSGVPTSSESQGQRNEARAIYDQLRTADVPEYVEKGATRAEDSHSASPALIRCCPTTSTGQDVGPGRFSFPGASRLARGFITVATPARAGE